MHAHETDKIVVKILEQIAAEEKKPYKKIKKLFVVDCDFHITHRFWEILSQELLNHKYTDVIHCPGCKKFSLE